MRYSAHFLFAALLLSAVIAGFNWWVDPYAIYREGPADAPMRVMSERIFKTVKLARMPADVVFIGTSRTDIGIGREQPALSGRHLVNLATFGQPIRETRRLFELAVREGKPRTVVIGLDFLAFNERYMPPLDYVEDNYSPWRQATLLLSISSLSDALAKYRQPHPVAGSCCYSDGFLTQIDFTYAEGNYLQLFSASEAMFLRQHLPYPQCEFFFSSPDHAAQSLEDMHAIFELAQREHVDLRLFISPAHAWQWETLAAAGLWTTWEDWKRQLVAINEQEAGHAGRMPFPLWDFSGYDEVSSENLPDAGEKRLMRGYMDSLHYTPIIGQRLVARVFGASDDWGDMLDHAKIEAHLTDIRVARQQYLAAHKMDVIQIGDVVHQTAVAENCREKR